MFDFSIKALLLFTEMTSDVYIKYQILIQLWYEKIILSIMHAWTFKMLYNLIRTIE